MLVQFRNSILSLIWKLKGSSDREHDLLRSALRKNPNWLKGHQLLAEACLVINDQKTAYAACLCCLALATRQRDKARAYLLLGQCYTACGDASNALDCFEKSEKLSHTNSELHEHIAAAYLLQGDYGAATNQLKNLPENQLSAEAKAALQYAKSKIES